jgi:hypothetical protein
MASIDIKTGQIRDRVKGESPIAYYVPKTSKSFMKDCLQAHELIISLLGNKKLSKNELRTTVLRYVAFDSEGKHELVKKLVLQDYEQKPSEATIASIAETWFERKTYEGITDKHKLRLCYQKSVILKFFSERDIKTTADLNNDIAYEFIKWRNENNKKNRALSASVIKHELQILKQIAKVASVNGYIPSGSSDVTQSALNTQAQALGQHLWKIIQLGSSYGRLPKRVAFAKRRGMECFDEIRQSWLLRQCRLRRCRNQAEGNKRLEWQRRRSKYHFPLCRLLRLLVEC